MFSAQRVFADGGGCVSGHRPVGRRPTGRRPTPCGFVRGGLGAGRGQRSARSSGAPERRRDHGGRRTESDTPERQRVCESVIGLHAAIGPDGPTQTTCAASLGFTEKNLDLLSFELFHWLQQATLDRQ